MAREEDETVIICALKEASGTSETLGFTGQDLGGGRLRVPLTHENAEVLRKRFPFTAPVRDFTRDRRNITTKESMIFPPVSSQPRIILLGCILNYGSIPNG